MAAISVRVEGAGKAVAAFDEVETGIQNPRGPLQTVLREVMYPAVAERFAQSGPGWKPLSPLYAAYKRQRFGNQPILVATGKMRDALTGKSGSVYTVAQNWIQIRIDQATPYARYHQTGTKRIPARPPVSFTTEQQVQMGAVLEREFTQLIHGQGFEVKK